MRSDDGTAALEDTGEDVGRWRDMCQEPRSLSKPVKDRLRWC